MQNISRKNNKVFRHYNNYIAERLLLGVGGLGTDWYIVKTIAY